MRFRWLAGIAAVAALLALAIHWWTRLDDRPHPTGETESNTAVAASPAGPDGAPTSSGSPLSEETAAAPFDSEDSSPPPAPIRSVLVSARTNRPLAGITVLCERVCEEGDRPERHRCTSAEDGSFSFEGSGTYRVTTEDPFLVVTEDDGFASIEVERGSQIAIERAGRVTGRVEDEKGNPVASVSIDARSLSGGGPRWLGFVTDEDEEGASSDAITDAQGRYSLPPIPHGCVLAILARHPDFAVACFDGVAARGGEISHVPAHVLRRGVTLVVRVIGPNEEPIANAIVSVHASPLPRSGFLASEARRAETGAGGEVVFGHLSLERISLSVQADGFAPVDFDAVEVTSTPITILLEPGRTIAGRVRNARGEPSPDCDVVAFRPRGAAVDSSTFYATTDSEGHFEIAGLPQDRFTVHTEGAASVGDVSTETTDVELVVDCGEIRGRVVDSDTESPIAPPVDVYLETASDAPLRAPRQASIDVAGNFTFVGLPAGDFRVCAWAAGYHLGRTERIHVAPGKIVEGVPLGLSPMTRTAMGLTLSGVVVDARTGTPVVGARVQLGFSSRGSSEDTTQADGRFSIEAERPGAQTLFVEARGYPRHREVVLVRGPMQRTIRLDPGACVAGRVTLNGRPVADAHVAAVSANSCAHSTSDGTYSLCGVPYGHNVFICRAPDRLPQYREVDIPSSGGTQLDFDLSSARGGIRGRVRRGEAPEPFALVELSQIASSGEELQIVPSHDRFTDERGRFEIAPLLQGRYRLLVRPATELDGFGFASIVNVPEQGFASCDLVVAAESLDVLIVDERGDPVLTEVDLEISGTDANCPTPYLLERISGGSGRIERLAPGRYTIEVEAWPHGAYHGEVTVPSQPLEIRLSRRAWLRISAILPSGDRVSGDALLLPRTPGAARDVIESGGGMVAPGGYDVIVASYGYAPVAHGTIELGAGEMQTIEVPLAREAASLSIDLGNVDTSRVEITIRGAAGIDLAPIARDSRAYILAPGTYTVTAALPDGRRAEASVTLRDGDVTVLTELGEKGRAGNGGR